MKAVKVDQGAPQPEVVARAAAVLRSGGVIAFPTDTVYGLGVILSDAVAIEKLFALKGRPAVKGLIAMIAEPGQVDELADNVSETARRLAGRFWPGPLTLVLPARAWLPAGVTVNGTVGVRLPENRLARALIAAVGKPLATTSANLSGEPSAGIIRQINPALKERLDLVLDGGQCRIGLESTVVDTTKDHAGVIREGAIPATKIEEALSLGE